ncbi:MAG: dihydroneopterin aldolase [Alphaproteobacteria bacterium]|jgi:dihydroneopterin aldolase|tara:strand:+ start:3235 stop:3603 length:369 start_codon:yes stop_codon:yes gene_type:complete
MSYPLTRRFVISQINVICSIGIHDFERAKKQRITVDLEVLLSTDKEPQADTIEQALNYDTIREMVIEIATSRHFDLQETLARTIFDAVLALSTVDALMVRTAKPDVYEDVQSVAYQLSNLRH